MQTLMPYPDFAKSAAALDRFRLNSQRRQNLKIMQALMGERVVTTEEIHSGEYETMIDEDGNVLDIEIVLSRLLPRDQWYLTGADFPEIKNHPVVNLWRGYEGSLMRWQQTVCDEWINHKPYPDPFLERTHFLFFENYGSSAGPDPKWFGDDSFHKMHQALLIRMDSDFYRPIFGWGVDANTQFVYPEQEAA